MNKYYFINIGAEVIWHPEKMCIRDRGWTAQFGRDKRTGILF